MNNDDAVLGKALTRELNAAESVCPPLEEIAALVDGSVEAAGRDALMGHLASCGKCRDVFVLSRSLVSDGAAGAAASRSWRRFVLPSAMAAAAVVILAVSLTLREPPTGRVQVVAKNVEQLVPPAAAPAGEGVVAPRSVAASPSREGGFPASAAAMARVLVRESDPAQLAALAHTQDRVAGFAGEGDRGTLAFRIGMNALDLEIALLADDGERAQARATRLASHLQTLLGNDAGAEMEALADRLEKGEKPSSLAGKSGGIEAMIPREKLPYARLGAWAEGARLSAKSGNARFFSRGIPLQLRRIDTGVLPPEAAEAFGKISRRVQAPAKIDCSSVEKDLEELIRAF